MILIGATIQEHRKKQALSQEEFAVRVGVTRQAVSKWETDKAYPDLDKLVTICEILQVSIAKLVYGEEPAAPGEPLPDRGMADVQVPGRDAAGQPLEARRMAVGQELKASGIPVGKARGRGTFFRLLGMLALTGGAFLFCGALLTAALTHHAWKKEDSPSKHTRVERVYQQYTKADVSFLDDVSRRVTETVWLDVPGIREGDYLVCYTDGEQKNVYHEYHGTTLIVLAAAELAFFLLLLACIAECRRFARENKWHVLTDEEKGNAERAPVEERKENNSYTLTDGVQAGSRHVPTGGTQENAGSTSTDEKSADAGSAPTDEKSADAGSAPTDEKSTNAGSVLTDEENEDTGSAPTQGRKEKEGT